MIGLVVGVGRVGWKISVFMFNFSNLMGFFVVFKVVDGFVYCVGSFYYLVVMWRIFVLLMVLEKFV